MKKSKQLLLLTLLSCCVAIGNAQMFTASPASNSPSWGWTDAAADPITKLPAAASAETVKILPTASCFCKVSVFDLTNQQSGTGVCLDLTNVVNHSYSGLNPQNETNRNDCNRRCTDATAALTPAQKQSIADCACGYGMTSGTILRSYSAVGTKDYKTSQAIGRLVNTPPVTNTTCTCPATWAANQTNVLGGVTADGKCKKLVCQPLSVSPYPPDGTPIGTWGFTWGNATFAWGTAANGGAAICKTVIVSPKACRLDPM